MNSSPARSALRFACAGAVALLAFSSVCRAQGEGVSNQTQMGAMGGGMTDQLQFGNFGAQVAKDQDAAYKAFLKEQDPAKKIELGNTFLAKYPTSLLAEPIDVGMMNTYRVAQDWKNAFKYADSALKLQPDDVDVLATVGWTIPHVYNPGDPDADRQLDKAEKYSKHALEVLAKMAKPPGMNDSQFADAKTKRAFQAHSALGLVYFRRDDYENSAKELQLATQGNTTPDQTDLYVLGVDLQNLNRFEEAASAFDACAQIAGPLHDNCRQTEQAAKAKAASKSK